MQPELIANAADLDTKLAGRALLLRLTGQREVYVEVSRRSLRRLWSEVSGIYAWAKPRGENEAVLEIASHYEASMEGRVIR